MERSTPDAVSSGRSVDTGFRMHTRKSRRGRRSDVRLRDTFPKTKVHRIGDGAPRVREQTDRVSGGQGTFPTDFYHPCGYLSDASAVCSRSDFPAFLQPAKEERMTEVPGRMKPYSGPVSVPDKNAPVRRCIRYITDRAGQSGYK